ncbi:hypothetical protein HZS_7101 [Henneguya salminicola]|nr:hypothetical protein HZS_7101 [Henneguya salminicola]
MWPLDEGLAILRMGSELFIDATFHPFAQCLIVMSFDLSTDLFVPCVLALMSRRNLYCELLRAIIFQLKYVWSPKSVVVDFEKALLNSVKYQFPKSKIIGCYFHMRQGIFRRMKKNVIPDDETQIALDRMRSLLSNEDDQINEKLQEIQNL